jgi:hypothetical protein
VSVEHWLALVARVLGTVRYVDAALHDRIVAGRDASLVSRPAGAPPEGFRNWRGDYFDCVAAAGLLAEVLRVRCGELMRPRDRRIISRYLKAVRGERALKFLLSARKRGRTGDDVVLRYRRGVVWRRLARARARVVWASATRGTSSLPTE